MPPTVTREADASSVFLTFLRDAAAARASGATADEARCFDAAAKLHPLDGASLDALITALLAQQRHAEAIELAAIIAPPMDYETPLLSLPLIFDTREETIPSAPYLVADAAAREAWRKRLAGGRRLKVGLAWTGSRGHQRNPFRSVGWQRYAAHFAGISDVTFYSMQPGAAAEVAAARAAGLDMIDHTASLSTFDDTAAFVSALDLVITVCTSVSHLSGALGQRTWVLLDVNPHWVWLLERSDSPWYPSATLYRQPRFGEWEPALEAVAGDLRALAAQHRGL